MPSLWDVVNDDQDDLALSPVRAVQFHLTIASGEVVDSMYSSSSPYKLIPILSGISGHFRISP